MSRSYSAAPLGQVPTRLGAVYARTVSGSVVLRIELELVPTDRGGRRRPLADGYRASMSFGRRRRDVEPIVHDAVLVLEDAGELAPGERARARAWVVSPDELPRSLEAGAVFTLLEGDRIVGRARLVEVLEDPAPHPLRDLAAARVRRLHAPSRGRDVERRGIS